ncbi:MAG: TIGR02206 family membrane protein [Porticoccaceae bacterium]|jgi:hypothetical integral membrane protein (TIGR02206 family)
MSDLAFFRNDLPFSAYSTSHSVVMLIAVALIALIFVANKKLNYQQNLLIGRSLSLLLALTVVVYTIFEIVFGRFTIAEDLPLSTCNLFCILAPWLFWRPNFKFFVVVYFLVMAGTLQAVITPDLYRGFPSYGFFKYWITHVGLVLLVIHYLVCFELYPTAKSMLSAFAWLNIYVLALLPINFLLGANYFYLMAKPINPSVLDYFGPWPIYILVAELLVMGFFAIAMLPVILVKRTATNSLS